MIKTSDEGFLAVGYSKSNGGDIGPNAGNEDAIAFKLDSEGETIWSTVIGGDKSDEARDVVELADGSYLIGILSQSSQNGDFSATSNGDYDYWIFKYSADGKPIWSKNYGGDQLDKLRALAKNSEGTVLAAGNSESGNSGDVTASNSGKVDIWSFTLKPDSKIALDSINAGDFIDNTIATNRIKDEAIQAADIDNASLGAKEINGIVDASKIADDAIDGTKLYDGDETDKLLSDTNLADNSIETDKVGAVIKKSLLDSSSTEFQKIFDLGDSESHADGLHFHKRGSESCPSGYTDLGSLGFCIRNNNLDKAPKDALNSTESCQDDAGIHARVCTFQEYTTACKKDASTLNLTNNSDYLFAGYSTSKALGFQYKNDSNCKLHSTPKAFNYGQDAAVKVRCCITK